MKLLKTIKFLNYNTWYVSFQLFNQIKNFDKKCFKQFILVYYVRIINKSETLFKYLIFREIKINYEKIKIYTYI